MKTFITIFALIAIVIGAFLYTLISLGNGAKAQRANYFAAIEK